MTYGKRPKNCKAKNKMQTTVGVTTSPLGNLVIAKWFSHEGVPPE